MTLLRSSSYLATSRWFSADFPGDSARFLGIFGFSSVAGWDGVVPFETDRVIILD